MICFFQNHGVSYRALENQIHLALPKLRNKLNHKLKSHPF